MNYTCDQLAAMIDHSLLQPDMTETDMIAGCRTAAQYRVASVCIKPYYIAPAAEILAGSGVSVGTTIGFPHGGHATAAKLAESEQALGDGATELDMVVNIGRVLSGDWDPVTDEITRIVRLARARDAIVKVIFENCYLQDEHKVRLCRICAESRAQYVKTSTGFGSGGATEHDVRLMRQHSPPEVGVKAAGGIRDLDALMKMRALGATRIGASRTAEILAEAERRSQP